MEFTSQKGKRQMSLEGFIYRFDKKLKNGTESWRCVKKLCKGRMYMSGDQVDSKGEHNHEPNVAQSEVKQCLSRIRQRAQTSRDTPKHLIQQELANLSQEAVGQFPKYTSAQRMISRKRKFDGEPVPTPKKERNCVKEIDIPGLLKTTLEGERLLLHDSGSHDPDRFLIFGTKENFKLLTNNSDGMFDGTFNIAPYLFYQLTTSDKSKSDTESPSVYIFLQQKTEAAYGRVLETICALSDSKSNADNDCSNATDIALSEIDQQEP